MSADGDVPKVLPVLLIVGTLVGAAVTFAGSASAGRSTVLPVVTIGAVVAINTFIAVRALRRGRRPAKARYTGQTLSPAAALGAERSLEHRWVGAGKLRVALGLVHASWPLAVLSLADSSLELRLRPKFLEFFFSARPLRVEPASGEVIFPARGRFEGSWLGVLDARGGEGYISTKDVATVLALLGNQGFNVSWEVRKLPFM